MIKKGADAMGWSSQEITRFWKYKNKKDRKGRRQSMTETLVPSAVEAGCRLHPHIKVERLVLSRGITVAAEADNGLRLLGTVLACQSVGVSQPVPLAWPV